MTKDEAFYRLWVEFDYCEMGYPYESLKKSMSNKEVLRRLKEEDISKHINRR